MTVFFRRVISGTLVLKRSPEISMKSTPLRLDSSIAYANDPVGISKVASKFAKDNEKFVLLGGGMGGEMLDEKSSERAKVFLAVNSFRAPGTV